MRLYFCEVDPNGLRRFIPEDLIPRDELRHLAPSPPRRPAALFWTLLADGDAEDLRADFEAGRHAVACGLLLNRAVEIIFVAASPGSFRGSRVSTQRIGSGPRPVR